MSIIIFYHSFSIGFLSTWRYGIFMYSCILSTLLERERERVGRREKKNEAHKAIQICHRTFEESKLVIKLSSLFLLSDSFSMRKWKLKVFSLERGKNQNVFSFCIGYL